MIRIVKLSGKYYGYDMTGDNEEEIANEIEDFVSQGTSVLIVNEIEDFVSQGTSVLIVNNVSELEDFLPDILSNIEVIMVERKDEETK